MAGENLTVVHRKTPTAYFDLKNRLLCCPIFKDDISSELYDLFMGHEVGHALWTPYEGVHSAVTRNKTLKGYLNVIEDVRIEKNIRNKYQGLRRSFFTAYNELMELDFFGIKGKNLQELSLIDKINLVTKCGSRVAIKFTKEEQFFLDWANKCESWEEVEECAEAIYNWSKENETRTVDDENEEEESESKGERKETGGGTIPQGSAADYDDEDGARESITEHNAHNNEEQFVSETNMVKTQVDLREKKFNEYVENTLYDYKLVLEDWRDYWNKELGSWESKRLG